MVVFVKHSSEEPDLMILAKYTPTSNSDDVIICAIRFKSAA